MSSSIRQVNPQADVIGSRHALLMNITAAKGIAEVLKSNLGPKGTMKMLVGGAGQIKITKDGKVLLDEMQIQHPTAAIIARTATAQEDMTGDGTTSNVLFTGDLLGQCERYLSEGVHPRVLVDGIELAREEIMKFLEEWKTKLEDSKLLEDREFLTQVARTALRTKLTEDLADHLTPIVVDAVTCIRRGEKLSELDLHMVEIMTMKHQTAFDTRFVDGLVLDHGARHPDMPKRIENAYILILNDSLEFEKSEINAGFFYKSAEERQRLATSERKFTDDKVNKVIAFKQSVCGDDKTKGFVIINQKGIDPISLSMLAKHGISALRRAKRRNAERLQRSVGGSVISSVDDLAADSLGYAKLVYEHTVGDEMFTFIEGCKNPTSCTVLIKGSTEHIIKQQQDALHDGLRAVKCVLDDKCILPGAGAFELAAYCRLLDFQQSVQGRAKLGVQAFADALLIIPKVLAANGGQDQQQAIIELVDETKKGKRVGIDVDTGKSLLPEKVGIWDNARVKKQLLHLGSMMAINLLLVDEVIRAGKKMGGK